MEPMNRVAVAVRCMSLLLLLQGLTGCVAVQKGRPELAMMPMPRELDKISLPAYRVEPPDILLIEAVNQARRADEPLRTGDELQIQIADGIPIDLGDPDLDPIEKQVRLDFERQFKVINGPYLVRPNGYVDLGPEYGVIRVASLTSDEAEAAIAQHLTEKLGLKAPKLSVSLMTLAAKQPVAGEHLVRPDGTVSLGVYGSVYVAGMTLSEVKFAVENHLQPHIEQPEVNVDVVAYNSKVYYVITDGGGFGEQVVTRPATGNETVLDAVASINGLSDVSSKRMWIARPAPTGPEQAQILEIDWTAIAARGITTTNYQVLPGDRIYIMADHLIAADNVMTKLFAPIERIVGFSLLGTSAYRQFKFINQQNIGGVGGGGGGGNP